MLAISMINDVDINWMYSCYNLYVSAIAFVSKVNRLGIRYSHELNYVSNNDNYVCAYILYFDDSLV